MQSTHQPHERAPEAGGMHGPETVTSRAPRELPAVIRADLSIPIYIKLLGRVGPGICHVSC